MNPFDTTSNNPILFPPKSQEVPSLMTPNAANLTEDDEVVNWGENFAFDGFQVVRAEFFANLHVPSVTFNQNRMYVNSACLAKFPNTSFIVPSVDENLKLLALLPSSEFFRESQKWCRTDPKGKRVPRMMTCRVFNEMVFSMMRWQKENRYKLLGQLVYAHGITFMAFDLNSHGVYKRFTDEDGITTISRSPTYPEKWEGTFGPTVREHQESLQLCFFGDYVMFSVEDQTHKSDPAVGHEEQKELQGSESDKIGGDPLDSQQ